MACKIFLIPEQTKPIKTFLRERTQPYYETVFAYRAKSIKTAFKFFYITWMCSDRSVYGITFINVLRDSKNGSMHWCAQT